MKEKEKLTCILQTRVTRTQKDQIDEMGANLREIVQYYIDNKTNPILDLKNRQRVLLKEIPKLEKELSEKKEELKEVNEQLGIPNDENIATLEVSTIAERIKDNCQTTNGGKCDKDALVSFISSKKGKAIIYHGLGEFGIKEQTKRELFMINIVRYLKLEGYDIKLKDLL